ncbi:MAG: lipopolysaccharide biosynthesis protein [Deltaproteobacteria bacterium]|nr:lipopolysaccharide biosynthesis protein [Deltaproteobacteria bacterium]
MNNGKNNLNSSEEIDLLDYWRVLKKRRNLIAYIIGASLVIAVVLCLALPKYYIARASVMPPKDDSMLQGITSELSGSLGGLASLAGADTPADLWVGILKSRNVKDAIIKKFGLMEAYDMDTIQDTLEELEENVAIEKSEDDDIVSVTVEDKDPVKAANMANAYIQELDRINRGSVMTSGHRTRSFIEKRLQEAKTELQAIEGALKHFQERNKAVKLDDQSKAIIESIGELKGQLMAKEVELDTLQSYAAPTNPRVQLLKTSIDGLKKKLRELEAGRGTKANPSARDVFIPTDRIPGLTLEYATLLRDGKIQETVFELLTQQYEMARIQEVKDTPTVQILDYATPPDKEAKPKETHIFAFAFAGGILFSVFTAFFLEYIEKKKLGEA